MSESELRNQLDVLSKQLNVLTTELAKVSVMLQERYQSMSQDLRELQEADKSRRCFTHTEKLKTLERMVWGAWALLAGIIARLVIGSWGI